MGSVELRLGRWQDVLADVETVDTIVTDPPYGLRTHRGHDATQGADGARRCRLGYDAWNVKDVEQFVDHWSPRCYGWFCTLTSHDLVPAWEFCLRENGRYVFAPVPCVVTGSRVRLQGDGPSSWTSWLVVARPRHEPYSKWGTLPGAYIGKPERRQGITGGKPLWLMRRILDHYATPGLICDPCAGWGTTLLAARELGYSAIGAEVDEETHAQACRRLEG